VEPVSWVVEKGRLRWLGVDTWNKRTILTGGAGICSNGLTNDLYFPLGQYTSVFQAEAHAILQCALTLKRLDSYLVYYKIWEEIATAALPDESS